MKERMHHFLIGSCGLGLVAALSLGLGGVAVADDTPFDEPNAVPGEAVLIFDDASMAGRVLESAERSDALDAEVVADDLDGRTVVVVEYPDGTDERARALMSAAEALPGVEAQPNFLYELMDSNGSGSGDDAGSEHASPGAYPDDPRVDEQYYLGPIGDGSSDSGTNVRAAWDLVRPRTDRSSVTVALIDTGVDLTHPDLQATVDRELAYDVTKESHAVVDTRNHGTMSAGIVGATADNGQGVAGVTSGSDCDAGTGSEALVSVLPVKVFFDGSKLASTANVLKGLDYLDGLVEGGQLTDLRVVNVSLGVYEDRMGAKTDEALHSAMRHLTDAHGVLCVCAGGNGELDGAGRIVAQTRRVLPADYDECLSVTSLTAVGGNAEWSDYNAYKDVSAPGVGILSTAAGGDYSADDGTSFSAPIVSGVAAMMYTVNPDLTPADAIRILKETAAALPDPHSVDRSGVSGSAGVVDAAGAVKAAIDAGGASEGGEAVEVYRLYNEFSREHLYTASSVEREQLVGLGWRDEGLAWTAPRWGIPVYRLINPWSQEHFYTGSRVEMATLVAAGWVREGVGWHSDYATGERVYRLFNPWDPGVAGHLYTTDASEYDTLSGLGWNPEGVGWYGLR